MVDEGLFLCCKQAGTIENKGFYHI